ncbi:MAG: peptide-methionine (S)-S-oxide reductase MsrA [Aeromicrobium sp.]
MIFGKSKTQLPDAADALPGRATRPHTVGDRHLVLGHPIETDPPEGMEAVVVGLGCFWGEEKTFWEVPGVWSTSVGYAGGVTPNPTYEEVCTGRTGHAEVVRIIFDPSEVSFQQLLQVFWENHDPTQGMRQGNDRGSQYRSILLTTTPEQQELAEKSRGHYQEQMTAAGYGQITTSIQPLGDYYYAEEHHQQYLVKNPDGYCPLHATGISYDG